MIQRYQPIRLRFGGVFEFDLRTSELFKNGYRIRLQDQPAKLLCLLLTHPRDLITRADIQKLLWEDQFVEVDHGINAAIKKIRSALDEDPVQPKFIETLAKKGYRFVGDVEEVYEQRIPDPIGPLPDPLPDPPPRSEPALKPVEELPVFTEQARSEERPFTLGIPVRLARSLFLFIQLGYVVIYCVTLINFESLEDALINAGLEPIDVTLPLVLLTAMCGIAIRIYLFTEIGWAHPAAGRQFRRLFPLLLIFDAMWAASPLLVGRKIGFGVALAGVAGLAYLPFAQRTLMITIAPEAYAQTTKRV